MLRHRRFGFSLVEVLVVLGIISLLLSLTIPVIQHARAAADKVACQSNLHQIGLALQLYHNDYGHLPPHRPRPWLATPDGMLTWHALLYPYIDQGELSSQTMSAFQQTRQVANNPPHIGMSTVIPLYLCPSDSRLRHTFTSPTGVVIAYTSYMGVAGSVDNILDGSIGTYPSGPSFAAIFDGLSHTVVVGERPPPDSFEAGFVYARPYIRGLGIDYQGPGNAMPVVLTGTPPGDRCGGPFIFGPGRTDNPCDKYHFWSLHPHGGNFLFADGGVRFLSYSIGSNILPALATRNGGETVQLPD